MSAIEAWPLPPSELGMDPRFEPAYMLADVSMWLGVSRQRLRRQVPGGRLWSFFELCLFYVEMRGSDPGRIENGAAGLPWKLYPPTRQQTPHQSPRSIEIRTGCSGGLPAVFGTGIRVDALADRFRAGDSVEALAEDFRITVGQVEEALRFALLCAGRR